MKREGFSISGFVAIFCLLLLCCSEVYAGLNFVNRESEFVLQPGSKMRLTPATLPVGFGRSSIIKQRAGEGNYDVVAYTQGDGQITYAEASSDLVYDNSNAINALDVGDIADLVRYNSNTLLFLDRTDSNAKLFLARNNSNAIINVGNTVRTDSNAFAYGIKNNSNAIVSSGVVSLLSRYNSNALLYLDRTDSNAKLFLARNNSNAVIKLGNTVRTDSNAFSYGIKNNSNAIVTLDDIALQLLFDIEENTKNIRYNSNTLLYLDRTDSNAKLFLARNNSNAVIKLGNTVRTDSNAFAYEIKNNSNAIVSAGVASLLSRYNSNTLLYLDRTDSNAKLFLARNNSNAVIKLGNTVRTDSNAFARGIRNNSNAIVSGGSVSALIRYNSNTLLFLDRTDSNAKLFLARNNSNAIVSGSAVLSRYNSNALLFLTKNNSNAILAGSPVGLAAQIHNNSQAIVWHDMQLQTIDHGPLDITITTITYAILYDIYLSEQHIMNIQNSVEFDGNGHSIYFASDSPNILQIAAGSTVVFKNVVFRNYYDAAIQLGSGANVVFGNGVILELQETQQMMRPWIFTGNTTVFGCYNRVTLDPIGIEVLPHSRLELHNLSLNGLKGNNIHCDGDTATVAFSAGDLQLDNIFSFTSGAMEFLQDVVMRGTNTFNYESDAALTVTNDSRLRFEDITFRYAPSVASKDLFVLFDQTSQLFVDGVTLVSTRTGMRLTRGTLIVDHKNYLINDGAYSLSEGFGIGNGDVLDDLEIKFMPGGSINLVSGLLDYQNINLAVG
jgi:hypothetical protein